MQDEELCLYTSLCKNHLDVWFDSDLHSSQKWDVADKKFKGIATLINSISHRLESQDLSLVLIVNQFWLSQGT